MYLKEKPRNTLLTKLDKDLVILNSQNLKGYRYNKNQQTNKHLRDKEKQLIELIEWQARRSYW